MLTAQSCKLLYYSIFTLFSSQTPLMSRYRHKKCLLWISGTSTTSALHAEIFTVVNIILMEKSWENEVKCQEKNVIWIISWGLTTLWYPVVCVIIHLLTLRCLVPATLYRYSPLCQSSSPHYMILDLISGGSLRDKNPGKMLLVNQENPSNPTCRRIFCHILWCFVGFHEMQICTWR